MLAFVGAAPKHCTCLAASDGVVSAYSAQNTYWTLYDTLLLSESG